MHELIVTNGDVAADLLQLAGLGDAILPWRDVLYDGPVPFGLDLASLSKVRAGYLASRGWGHGRDLGADFVARDALLAGHADFDLVTLWFEHDPCDTLQLLQVLDFFAGQGRDAKSLRIVHSDGYLGRMEPEQVRELAVASTPVGTARLNQATEAWARWREPDPRLWGALLNRPRLGIKRLWHTVLATLGHFPQADTGLTRAEQWIVETVAEHDLTIRGLFGAYSRDTHAWCGTYISDWSFYAIADRLAAPGQPLIDGIERGPFAPALSAPEQKAYLASRPVLTDLGRKVLVGEVDYCDLVCVDHWVGGAHVTNAQLFRYDARKCRLVGARR